MKINNFISCCSIISNIYKFLYLHSFKYLSSMILKYYGTFIFDDIHYFIINNIKNKKDYITFINKNLFRISIDNDDIELSKWIYENYNISEKDIKYVNKQISMCYDWNNYKWIKNIDVEDCFKIACLNNNLKNIDYLKPFISKKDIYCEITKSIINNNYETFEKLIEISIFSQKDGQ